VRRLEAKIPVITDGTSGIGQSTARLFHEEGARVFVSGRSDKMLAEAAKLLRDDLTTIQCGASPLENPDELVTTLEKKAGHIGVLFINAGISKFAPFESITPEVFDEMFNTTFRNAYSTVPLPVTAPSSVNSCFSPSAEGSDAGVGHFSAGLRSVKRVGAVRHVS
jgi:NAD(P)-dependent dehydrogenase (short-subunit alcohol dehydrogenase family)